MNRNALHSVILAASASLSMFAAACGSDHGPKPWAMRPITRDYTFPTRDADGQVVPEGVTVSAADLNKGRTIYTHYCYACHGMNGDGKGPASHGLRPAPRDLRMGKYKFDSVVDGLPNDIDFVRIIKGGLHGTAMLKWDIKSDELFYLIQFIKTFPEPVCNAYTDTSPECLAAQSTYPESSIEAEKGSVWEAKVERVTRSLEKLGVEVGQPKPTGTPLVKQNYDESGNVVVDAPEDPWRGREAEAVKKGEELYHFSAQCTLCHAHYLGRKAIYDYSISKDPQKAVTYRADMFYAVPQKNTVPDFGVATMPPDFTMNPLRSIRAESELPDLYRLIGSGVGVMPPWVESLTPEQLWAIVHYVKSLKDLQLPANSEKRDALKAQLHGDKFVPPAPKPTEPEPTAADAPAGDAAAADAPAADAKDADAKGAEAKGAAAGKGDAKDGAASKDGGKNGAGKKAAGKGEKPAQPAPSK